MDAVAVQILAPIPIIVIKFIKVILFDRCNKNHFTFVAISQNKFGFPWKEEAF